MLIKGLLPRYILSLFISISISLADSGIKGMVTNSYGYPLTGVFVCALEAEKGEICWSANWPSHRIVETDSNGFYFMDLPEGYYSTYATLDSTVICGDDSVVLVNNGYLDLNFAKDVTLHEPGSVSGIVTDQNGRLLHGCNVLAQTYRAGTLTNLHGEYILTGLPPGIHSIEANYHGMQTIAIDSVLIFPSQESVYNFDTDSGKSIPDTTGSIAGRVTDDQGNLITSGAPVTVRIQGTYLGAHADSIGSYHIYDIEPGKYILTAMSMGYLEAKSRIIEIHSGEVQQFNFDPSTFLQTDSTGGGLRLQPYHGTFIYTDSNH